MTSDSSCAAFHRQIGSTTLHIKKNVIIRRDCPSYIINVSRPTPYPPRPTHPPTPNPTPILSTYTAECNSKPSHIFIPKERSNYFRLFQLQHYKSPSSTAKKWEEEKRSPDKGTEEDVVFPLILRSLTWGSFWQESPHFISTTQLKAMLLKVVSCKTESGIASRSS